MPNALSGARLVPKKKRGVETLAIVNVKTCLSIPMYFIFSNHYFNLVTEKVVEMHKLLINKPKDQNELKF